MQRNGGTARPARPAGGDVDLESLQEAFLRNNERPSARVIRSKAPAVKTAAAPGATAAGRGATLNEIALQRAHVSATTHSGGALARAGQGRQSPSTTGRTAEPTQISQPASQSGRPSRFRGVVRGLCEEQEQAALPPAAPATLPRPPTGGLVLDAPGVVSGVRERNVQPPAPMRIAVGGAGSGRGVRESLSAGFTEACTLPKAAEAASLGGFPQVRHRSDMQTSKLGGRSRGADGRSASVSSASTSSVMSLSGSTAGSSTRNSGVPDDIHEENLSRLAAMTPEEITEAQQEIRSVLSPAAIEMLRRKNRVKGSDVSQRATSKGVTSSASEGRGVGSGFARFPDRIGEGRPRGSKRAAANGETSDGDGRSAASGKQVGNAVDDEAVSDGRAAAAAMTSRSGADGSRQTAATGVADGDGIRRQPSAPAGSLLAASDPGNGIGAPTVAQRAATAAGGVATEAALRTALQSLPPGERAKSSWTLGGDEERGVASRGASAETRVDLDGIAVATREGYQRQGGSDGGALHHHGDDPEKAGYTPNELVRLARSTVPGQRQLSLRALAGLLRERAAFIRRGQPPPGTRPPVMLPVALRMSLDDTNPSVTSAALIAIEAFLCPLAELEEEEESAVQGLSWVDYQAYSHTARPLCTPREEAGMPRIDPSLDDHIDDGLDGAREAEETVAEHARKCREDPCTGMLQMSLLQTMTSIAEAHASAPHADGNTGRSAPAGGGGLPPRGALAFLRILIALARRAPWAARRVAAEAGLLEAVREAFLEPRDGASFPFDLSEAPPIPTAASEKVALPSTNGFASTHTNPRSQASPELLALLAVRLVRTLVQSSRDVALSLSATPVLASATGVLGLGQRLRRPRTALVLAQREVLHLWRCCLSYGIGVDIADTVVLVARGHGWWPGVPVVPLARRRATPASNAADCGVGGGETPVCSPKTASVVDCDNSERAGCQEAECEVGSTAPGKSSDSDPSRGYSKAFLRLVGQGVPAAAVTEVAEAPPQAVFLRALHQLACVCVCPSTGRGGGDQTGDASRTRMDRAARDPGAGTVAGGAAVLSVAGVTVSPDTWADLGDTVDGAAEGAIRWLLRCCGRSGGTLASGTTATESAVRAGEKARTDWPDLVLQSAAIHLVACWLERYRSMSRTKGGANDTRRLEPTAEDAAVLFSILFSSPALPAVITSATRSATVLSSRITARSPSPPSASGPPGTIISADANEIAHDSDDSNGGNSRTGAATATAMTALDWLSGLFRLGLACEKLSPGEAAAAARAAPLESSRALADFLSSSPENLGGEGGAHRPYRSDRGLQSLALCSLRRASASARWLGCRFTACLDEQGRAGGTSKLQKWSWPLLARDCALKAVSLCEPGEEAVAVGLVSEGLEDRALVGTTKVQGLADGPATTYHVTPDGNARAAEANSLLRKLFRGAISDPVALSHSSFHLDGRWNALQSLVARNPQATASLLPLPQHWLLLPLASQAGEQAAAAAVSACLSTLVRLEGEGSGYVTCITAASTPALDSLPMSSSILRPAGISDASNIYRGRQSPGFVSPEVKLYHLANTCMYGASALSFEGAERDFEWLLRRYLAQCGRKFEPRLADTIARLSPSAAPDPAKMIADAAAAASMSGTSAEDCPTGTEPERGLPARDRVRAIRAQSRVDRALLDFVKDLVASFLADSFGVPAFSMVLRMFVRTGFPAAVRCIVWKELGSVGLLRLLDSPSHVDRCGGSSTEAKTLSSDSTRGPSSSDSAWDDAFLYPPDSEPALLDTYMTALEHPRFGPGGEDGKSHGIIEATPDGAEETRTASASAVSGDMGKLAQVDDERNGGTGRWPSSAPPRVMTTEKTMWRVAVHHLACHLFPREIPSPAGATPHGPEAVEDDKNAGIEAFDRGRREAEAWRPDFGRRRLFSRLLEAGRGGGGRAASPATVAAVIAHRCPGTWGDNLGAKKDGDSCGGPTDAAITMGVVQDQGTTGTRDRSTCSRLTAVDAGRLFLLQAYCRGVDLPALASSSRVACGDSCESSRLQLSEMDCDTMDIVEKLLSRSA